MNLVLYLSFNVFFPFIFFQPFDWTWTSFLHQRRSARSFKREKETGRSLLLFDHIRRSALSHQQEEGIQ